jgi:8-oxo-dGTP diphosphatase
MLRAFERTSLRQGEASPVGLRKERLMLDVNLRVRVGALIQDDAHRLLCIRHRRRGRSYWTLPGGAPKDGEILAEALQREVAEETGYKIQVDDLCAVGEVAETNGDARRLVMFFRASVLAAGKPSPTLREQLDEFEWLSEEQLRVEPFYPSRLLSQVFGRRARVYLGDITDEIR